MVDSNGDSKEAVSHPHSSLESGPRSKGSEKKQELLVGDEIEIEEVHEKQQNEKEEGKAIETEEELSALFNPYLPIKMFTK